LVKRRQEHSGHETDEDQHDLAVGHLSVFCFRHEGNATPVI
jgi:hypothetical protein